MEEYRERYQEWLDNPYFDEETKAELRALAGNEEEIKVVAEYDLEIQGQVVSQSMIVIDIKNAVVN